MIHKRNSILHSNWKTAQRGCAKWKVTLGRRVGPKEAVNKRRERILVRQDIFFWGEESTEGFYHPRLPVFLLIGLRKRAHITDYLIDADQKIPHWWMKTVFLGDVEIAIRSGSKTEFGIMGFGTNDTIWARGFLFNRTYFLFCLKPATQ